MNLTDENAKMIKYDELAIGDMFVVDSNMCVKACDDMAILVVGELSNNVLNTEDLYLTVAPKDEVHRVVEIKIEVESIWGEEFE